MDNLVKKSIKTCAMVGTSKNNGHPYSFSALINGYNPRKFFKCGWNVIDTYMKKNSKLASNGIDGLKVTHAWTQHLSMTETLAESCEIDNIVENYEDLVGKTDSVIIARDDFENHLSQSIIFLEAGQKVFIDKPLTLSEEEFIVFKKFINNGQLMTTSGMRFSNHIIGLKNLSLETPLLINCSVVNCLPKYGIHMIDATLGWFDFEPLEIERLSTPFDSYIITTKEGAIIKLNCLGENVLAFSYQILGDKINISFNLTDNFFAFRNTLIEFRNFLDDASTIKPSDMIKSIDLLIKLNNLNKGERCLA